MRRISFCAAAVLLSLSSGLPAAEKPKDAKPQTLSDKLDGMSYRPIGPYRGGRSVAVTGVRHDPLTYYFGGTGGGVWEPVSDRDFKT